MSFQLRRVEMSARPLIEEVSDESVARTSKITLGNVSGMSSTPSAIAPAAETPTSIGIGKPVNDDADSEPSKLIIATAPSVAKFGDIDDRPRFRFTLVEDARFSGFQDKETQALLYKWGMQDRLYIKRFLYDTRRLDVHAVPDFLIDLFDKNPHVRVATAMDQWGTLGNVISVTAESTLHTITNMSFFDRLKEKGVVRSTGEIRKCLDEVVHSFMVSDDLRKCLIADDDPIYDIFSSRDRSEFIFHVFKAVCLGGRLCQFEDELEPYLDVTKKLYKDLVTVTKDAHTGKLRVASLIYKITSIKSSVSPLFPMDHPQNFCYVCIDPMRRHVNVMYHASDQYY